MGYTIKCCNCKKEIDLDNKELFFVVQPTIFEDNDWKRVKYGGFKQFMLCIKCIRKKRKWKKKI
ncbi:MAG: hypothetical protein KAR08_08145 [Candidatus Heimdallarchaeota archaeon]|nr:hypothetical protein [Candidatus Heimdallarchaeota archaeon]